MPESTGLRQELMILAGYIVEGEPIPKADAEIPLETLVTRICADRTMTQLGVALIAITLAKAFNA